MYKLLPFFRLKFLYLKLENHVIKKKKLEYHVLKIKLENCQYSLIENFKSFI